jgi:hypothetical protein
MVGYARTSWAPASPSAACHMHWTLTSGGDPISVSSAVRDEHGLPLGDTLDEHADCCARSNTHTHTQRERDTHTDTDTY